MALIIWKPSKRSESWSVEITDDTIIVQRDAQSRIPLAEVGQVRAKHGLISSEVRILNEPPLRGLSRRAARDMVAAVERERARVVNTIRIADLTGGFDRLSAEIVIWARGFFAAARAADAWLTTEFLATWVNSKPGEDIAPLLRTPELDEHRASQSGEVLEAIDLWSADLGRYVETWNERFLQSELIEHRSFFDNVERSPLTAEQALAVVCFDNRVQLIASAGSGKTSTMIAKAGYAVYRGIVAPEQVVMLAFNAKAAAELNQRVRDRLGPLGIAADRIVTSTFHAFGLAVIGKATGRKPSLAPWLESGEDIAKLSQIVETLRTDDAAFRTEWDLFRIVLSRDLPAFGQEETEPDGWDAVQRKDGFRTVAGEVVRSQGERLIADWLFYNGVEYEYERRYEVDVADAEHRQYQPDFYYPTISTYHEHLALDAQGNAPEAFEGYLDGVMWKRSVHAGHGTALIETTMAQLWSGAAFRVLSDELTSRGVLLAPDPDRPVVGQPPIDSEKLIKTLRTFIVHAKSNRLSYEQMVERATGESSQPFRFRHEMFLRIYKAVRDRWDAELQKSDSIDFEDMLNLAADHLEAGTWVSPFRLVMVDEMQDASFARARLARALTRARGSHLFAVGDDWQSINRFAGADLSVMTGFEQWFGPGKVLRLQRTFRSPQSLCDISGRFVAKNPAQLSKQVISSTTEYSPTVSALGVVSEDGMGDAIRRHLSKLNSDLSIAGGTATVFLLGRYRHQEALMPSLSQMKEWKHISVRFSTIHGSKGLEADYVVIAGMVRDKSAFPSRTADDPVLRLAMPAGEAFTHAEERRLFYVALTRARRSVTLVTVENRESPFLLELIKDESIAYSRVLGGAATVIHCTSCETGVMVPRTGKNGKFYGCSNFPRCKQTMNEIARPAVT